MIERFVFIKLKEASEADRERLVADTLRLFSAIPQVETVRAGAPADETARAAWDLVIVMGFRQLDDIDGYRVSPPHVEFIENVLADRKEVLKAWNFEVKSP
jgi:hypothetical protein